MAALEIRKERRQFFASWPSPRPTRVWRAASWRSPNPLDGMSREAAARSAGMDRQTLRDWVTSSLTGSPRGVGITRTWLMRSRTRVSASNPAASPADRAASILPT
jgi:hypothetical protein